MIRAGRRQSRGQVLAEFALVAPILLLVIFGLMEGGYYVFAVTSVSHGTQEGARLAILPATPNVTSVTARVQQRAQPIVVPTGNVAVTVADKTSGVSKAYTVRVRGDRVAVATTYTHVPLIGYVFPSITFPSNIRSELFVE